MNDATRAATRAQMERITAIIARMASNLAMADTPETMRVALGRLTNASLRLGYAAFLMTGDAPDSDLVTPFIDAVEADGGATGHIIGGQP